ncbi:hypothetical protein C8J56DRAFT_1039006 [Mycena floridula]|nr:hypothetical protein C8J56DRAFT_1039006 [Mycena floridula]
MTTNRNVLEMDVQNMVVETEANTLETEMENTLEIHSDHYSSEHHAGGANGAAQLNPAPTPTIPIPTAASQSR